MWPGVCKVSRYKKRSETPFVDMLSCSSPRTHPGTRVPIVDILYAHSGIMKSLTALLVLATTAFSTPTSANRGPAPPRMSHLFTSIVTGAPPIVIGEGPLRVGSRIAYPFTGGTFQGPRLNGTILPIGGDFSILRPGNKFSGDGIAVFQTSDGANILMKTLGHQADGDFVYCTATFETGAEQYRWINTAIVVTRARVDAGGEGGTATLDAFVVRQLRPYCY